jgi:phosphatidate cytidylyltransferase
MLKTRLITALILVPIFLIALFYLTGLEWQLLILAGVVIAAWEWANLSKFNKIFKVLYSSSILVVGLLLMFVYPNLIGVFTLITILLSSVFWIFLAPIWLFTQVKIKNPILLGILGLTIILPLWFAMVSLRQVGPLLLLTIMMTVWIADSAAYFAGKRFGRHKLAASISPGKTWEGVWGACIAVALYAIAICYFFETEYWLLLLMLAVTVASVIGDLVESLFKRQAEVKDSGTIFPGHGGILDRIDGLTSSLPLVTFLLLLPVYYNHWFV